MPAQTLSEFSANLKMKTDTKIALALTGILPVICFICMREAKVVATVAFWILSVVYLLPFWIAKARGITSPWRFLALTLASIPLDAIVVGEVIWVFCLIWALVAKGRASIADATQPVNVVVHNRELPLQVGSELTKLVALREAGHLTEEEFLHQKRKLL